MIGGADRETRQQVILDHIVKHRAAMEEETQRLRVELADLARREAVLRDEIASLDAILAAIPEPPKESQAPSLFASAPMPEPVPTPSVPASVGTPRAKRRRKGSRREQLLPMMRERFSSRAFMTEDVTDLLLEAEPGERRKAYFAAWAIVRDLAREGAIEVVAVEGTGPRKRRTYRFAEAGRTSAFGAP